MLCKDCKVTSHEYLGTQHRLLVKDMVIKSSKMKKRSVRDPRLRWWSLTRENTTNLSEKMQTKYRNQWLNAFEGSLSRS